MFCREVFNVRIINIPIKMMAIYYPDGKIEPVKFRYDEQVVYVERILKTYEEFPGGNGHVTFVCQHNGRDTYELRYRTMEKTWYLYKK